LNGPGQRAASAKAGSGRSLGLPLPSYLTKPLRWLRAGYPQAPLHEHVPLIALMSSPPAQLEDLLGPGELSPVLISLACLTGCVCGIYGIGDSAILSPI
jgi:hypothetical protein